MFLRSSVKTELATPHPTGRKKNEKKQSVSKMKVQVATINSVVESSKSELSSRGKRPFKVFQNLKFAKRFSHYFGPQMVLTFVDDFEDANIEENEGEKSVE